MISRKQNHEPLVLSCSPSSRVLLVDDDPIQIKIASLRLRDAGFVVETALDAGEALEKAKATRPDIIVSDVLMGDVDGFGFCRKIREDGHLAKVPLILISAHFTNERDQQLALKVGATRLVQRTPDFLSEMQAVYASLKECSPHRPPGSNQDTYEEHLRANAHQLVKFLTQAENSDRRYAALFENANDAISVTTAEGVVLEVNHHWQSILGIPPEKIIGRNIKDFVAAGQELANTSEYGSLVKNGEGHNAVALQRFDGSLVYVEFSSSVIEFERQRLVLSIGRNITDKIQSAHALADAELKYRSLLDRIPDLVWSADERGVVQFANSNVVRLCGFSNEELQALGNTFWFDRIHPEDRSFAGAAYESLIRDHKPFNVEYRWRHKNESWVWFQVRGAVTKAPEGKIYLDGIVSDITEKKNLEENFRQAQKMEAIGQLTGGIAHDFNNILAVIIAYSQFITESFPEADSRREDAQEIRLAADRAASLTRQLLAFSRRQILEPTVMDINATVSSVDKMLHRLIGEDIDLSLRLEKNLEFVRADVGQVEQVIMNLVVNARDAMPTGGKILIETANVDFTTSHAATDMSVPPGRYVMLAVGDTGCGISADLQKRIFEPFFTTKEKGKGTGLGLSTCYGIVRQSNGYIILDSEVGKGTTFKIFLPRVDAQLSTAVPDSTSHELNGGESIVLIEDDNRVRIAVNRILMELGYQVFSARDGRDALNLAKVHGDKINLILSDVIIPGFNGPEVVKEIQKYAVKAKILFMSGYTDHSALTNGVFEAQKSFIQKPFSAQTLAKKIRDTLNA